jgi:hypothetical protein
LISSLKVIQVPKVQDYIEGSMKGGGREEGEEEKEEEKEDCSHVPELQLGMGSATGLSQVMHPSSVMTTSQVMHPSSVMMTSQARRASFAFWSMTSASDQQDPPTAGLIRIIHPAPSDPAPCQLPLSTSDHKALPLSAPAAGERSCDAITALIDLNHDQSLLVMEAADMSSSHTDGRQSRGVADHLDSTLDTQMFSSSHAVSVDPHVPAVANAETNLRSHGFSGNYDSQIMYLLGSEHSSVAAAERQPPLNKQNLALLATDHSAAVHLNKSPVLICKDHAHLAHGDLNRQYDSGSSRQPASPKTVKRHSSMVALMEADVSAGCHHHSTLMMSSGTRIPLETGADKCQNCRGSTEPVLMEVSLLNNSFPYPLGAAAHSSYDSSDYNGAGGVPCFLESKQKVMTTSMAGRLSPRTAGTASDCLDS